MSTDGMLKDGICRPSVTIHARKLLATVCVLGGADCPLISKREAQKVLDRVGTDPTVAIRLESNADEIPHYTMRSREDYERMDRVDVLNRKRDLDVLQRLGLVPGDTRRARYLYTLLFQRIETPDGICAFDTPGWEGCSLAKSGAYESVRERGWKAVVYSRPKEEMAAYRNRSIEQIESGEPICIRSHHLMCLCCWYGRSGGQSPRPNDTLYEIYQEIKKNPDRLLTLVEGCCVACDCCDGFHPETTRCVHGGGLIRDYKKDLDVFQKLGLMPGATMKAREVFDLLFERIPSTRDICGYGDGIVRSEDWRICNNSDGSPGYAKARETDIF